MDIMNDGTLSIVATPIGNLEDITLRALRTLREADYVLCEDTRVTGKLLHHHGITSPLKRYDAHASEKTHANILHDLEQGKHIALVSDAGTPGVSDPGVLLVARAREVGARVEAIPGPSALTAALSIAGIAGNQFTFLGFAPTKKGRETFFREVGNVPQPVVFFESTHRILKTMEALENVSDEVVRDGRMVTVWLARELTKLHEEVYVGTATEVRQYLEGQPVKQKGEFVVIVEMR
jgi:16S rRNA (cytidine1402-2'-O)-methyltransferase